jgi:hypothetical protein
MTMFAVAPRVVSTMLISVLGTLVPELFTNYVVIQRFLHQLMAAQQVRNFTHVCIGKHGSRCQSV